MKKKICVTIPTLHGAGCERMLSEVLPFYAEAFDVDLVLQAKQINYELPANINVIELGLAPHLRSTFSTIKRLRKLQKEKNYDAVVSYLDLYNVTVWLSLLFWRDSPPQVAVEQTTDREFFANSRMGVIKQWTYKFFLKLAYNRVERVVAVSNNLAEFLTSDLLIRTPITVIHNGVDSKKFNIDSPNLSNIEPVFVDAEVRILCISRLDYQKNIKFLLDSFAVVREQSPKAKLFILGTGPLAEQVELEVRRKELDGSVHLLGFHSNPEDYLKLAHVFVLTSRYESFGNVVIEALASGVPVVTTYYGGVVREMITSDDLGTVVEQGQTDAFAQAVVNRLNAEPLSKERLSNYVEENFSASKKAGDYVRVVNEVIDLD